MLEIYKFINFGGIEILFIKPCPLKLMSGNYDDQKLLSPLVIFSIFSWHSVTFQRINSRSVTKIFNVFLAVINTK